MSRVQVNGPGGQEPLRPAARPVDTYFRPNRRGPNLRLLTDFKEFSDNLRQLVSSNMDNEIRRQSEVGEAWVAQNPDLAKQINAEAAGDATPKDAQARLQAAFGKLVRSGQIPEGASPFFLRGFAKASAQSTLGAYQRAVEKRTSEVTDIVDPATGLEKQPIAPEQILSEEWAKVQDNPSLKNFYGQQVMADIKPKLDQEFLGLANKAMTEAKVSRFKETLAVNVAGQVDALAAKGKDVTSADLQGITDYITENAYKTTVKEPRAVAWEGVKLALARQNNIDHGEALRLADLMSHVKVAGVELGSDPKIGVELATLKRQFESEQQSEQDHQRAVKSEKRQDALIAGRNYFMAPLDQEAQKRGDVRTLANALAEKMTRDQMFGDWTPEVVDSMYEHVPQIEQRQTSDPATVTQFNSLIAAGKTDAAEVFFQAAVKSGSIVGNEVLQAHDLLNKSRSVTGHVEGNPVYDRAAQTIEKAAATWHDFSPDHQRELDQYVQQQQDGLNDAVVDYYRDHAGDTNAEAGAREIIKNYTAQSLAGIQQRAEKIQTANKTFLDQLSQRHYRFQDGSDLIQTAYSNGAINTQQYQVALDANQKVAATRANWVNHQDAVEGRSRIQAEITANSALSEQQKRDLSAKFGQRYDAVFTAKMNERLPKSDPATIFSDIRIAAQDATDEVLAQVGAGTQKVAEAGIAAGKSAKEISEAQTPVETDKALAEQWKGKDASFSADTLTPKRDKAVTSDYADSVAKLIKWDRQPEGWWARNLSTMQYLDPREAAEYQRWVNAKSILADTSIPEDKRGEAVGNAYALMGLSADAVLKGELVVAPPPAHEAAVRKNMETVRLMEGSPAYIQRMLDTLKPTTVDIKSLKIAPYTTPLFNSVDEIKAFMLTRPEDTNKLLTRLGVGLDDTSKQEWLNYQKQAINRVRAQ